MRDSPAASVNRNEPSDSQRTSLLQYHQDPPNTDSDSNGALWDIILCFAAIFIPFAVLSAVLVGVVLVFRVTIAPSSISGSSLEKTDTDVYYVDISATTLVLIASYSSTIASLIIGFTISLSFFPLAAKISTYSQRERLTYLPTPYQLGLLIALRNGSIGSLWSWIKYTFARKGERKTRVVKTAGLAVMMTLLLTYISLSESDISHSLGC